MKTNLDQNNDGKADFNYKMMYVPLSEGALKNEDGTNSMINYCSVNDMMFVPAEAMNVELAKEFWRLCVTKSTFWTFLFRRVV